MKKKLYRLFVELSNSPVHSLILKKFTQSKLSKPITKSFVKTYKINEEEMEYPLEQYESLQQLFIRRLKKGTRPIDVDSKAIVSPVDGVLAKVGQITSESSFFVKGQDYSLEEMLGSKEDAVKYKGGMFYLFYLSPSHYHRIHSPVNGEIEKQWQLGSRSYPVNQSGLKYGRRPLSRNYRLISEVKVDSSHVAIVKVGALNVNSIHTTHETNHLEKGEEMAYFSFGSTVILLFEEGMIESDVKEVPAEMTVGSRIATLHSNGL